MVRIVLSLLIIATMVVESNSCETPIVYYLPPGEYGANTCDGRDILTQGGRAHVEINSETPCEIIRSFGAPFCLVKLPDGRCCTVHKDLLIKKFVK